MKPIPMTKEQLVDTLRNIANLVEEEDSFEGSIEYMMPTDENEKEDGAVPGKHYAMVCASYRIGNSLGQGGVRLVGKL